SLPGIRALKNMRLILVYTFGLSVLAGFGISWLEKAAADAPRISRLRAGFLAAVGLLLGGVLLYILHARTYEMIEYSRRPRFSLLFLMAAASITAARLLKRLGTRSFQSLAIGLIACDVIS